MSDSIYSSARTVKVDRPVPSKTPVADLEQAQKILKYLDTRISELLTIDSVDVNKKDSIEFQIKVNKAVVAILRDCHNSVATFVKNNK